MILPGRLFIKIFLGFWLISVAVLGSWLIAAQYFESMPQTTAGANPAGPPHKFIKRLMYDLQNRSDQELPALLRSSSDKYNFDIYLLDADGRELYGRELTPGVKDVAEQLQQGRRRAFLRTSDRHFIGHKIYRREQGLLDAIIAFKPPERGLLTVLSRSLWLRVALAVLVSGLVCFALSRAVTNRVKQLQLASRRLAEGDFATRIVARDRGGDETDELARDFNSMAEQIEQQLQSQKRLLADVSHELRSPLARLRIALALAEDDSDNSARHLQRIDHETERLEELIGQLLSTQIPKANFDLHIDLAALLTELCVDASFEGRSSGKQVEFICKLDEAVIATHGDLLKKAFENILRNALKYTLDNSVVRAQLSLSQQRYVIRIEDRGPGVAEPELEKLFEEFYREDTARPRETGGYGLGLSIAKRAIVQHRGDICAQNTDDGLAIIVTLPADIE